MRCQVLGAFQIPPAPVATKAVYTDMQKPVFQPFNIGVYIIVAGWWRHQPGQLAVGGVPTAHNQPVNATIIYTHYYMSETH